MVPAEMQQMNIAFVGGGNMGAALIGGLLKHGWPAQSIAAVDIDERTREHLARDIGVRVYADAGPAVATAQCVVFAVKPQHLRESARTVAPLIKAHLVISIAAGIRAGDLSRWLLGHRRIVRAMPNTPALVQAGMTGLYALPGVSGEDRALAEKVLGAASETLWVQNEAMMDTITAVSGSGPAYVFYFLEALQHAALEQGFAPAAARRLALTTFTGALKLAAESADAPEVLRARVTSKGGTTERAIAYLERYSVRQHIVAAVAAATERSRELGDELGRDA